MHDPAHHLGIALHKLHGLFSIHRVGAAHGGHDLLHLATQHRRLRLCYSGDGHLSAEVECRRLAHCHIRCWNRLFRFAKRRRNAVSGLLQTSRRRGHHPIRRRRLWGVCLARRPRSTLTDRSRCYGRCCNCSRVADGWGRGRRAFGRRSLDLGARR